MSQPQRLSSHAGHGMQKSTSERVGLGLLGAAAGALTGVVLAGLLATVGVVAAISSFVGAALAVTLYTKLARSAPHRGLLPLAGVIIAGLVLSYFAAIAGELSRTFDHYPVAAPDKTSFLLDNVFTARAIETFGVLNTALFVAFGILGMWSTLGRLLRR